ncbi:MAG: thioredoxin [Victivallales bacterium]|jgi:thioredoxin 1|nr:thioredoxin [Victivallales bacterium]
MAIIKELNTENYDESVKSGIVLVDFWAPWCNPCRMLGTILEQVAAEAPENVVIGKVNIDENKDLAVRFEVMNIPCIFIYKDGKIVNDFSGVQSKPKLLEALKNA